MATTLNGTVELRLNFTYNPGTDLSTTQDNLDVVYPLTTVIAQGTGDHQCNVLWHDQRIVVAGTPDDIDVRTLTFVGATQDFAKIKGLMVYNRSTTAAEILQVGADAVAPISTIFGATPDYLNVHPSGLLFLWSPLVGYAVTATTADILQIISASGTITYDIALLGTNS